MRLTGKMLVIAVVLSSAVALPVGLSVSHNETAIANEELESVHLEIKGMICGDCQAKVKTALSKLPEVKEADVRWEAGTADVKVSKGTDHNKLKKSVEDAGFTVIAVKEEED